MKLYILKRGKPQATTDVLKWASWMETADNTIAYDTISYKTYVSTVFLGLDHNFHGGKDPVLFETMIFGGPRRGYQKRSATKKDALRGHKFAIALARGLVSDD